MRPIVTASVREGLALTIAHAFPPSWPVLLAAARRHL
jgi:hypothetical protein